MLAACFYNDGSVNNAEFEKIVSRYNKVILHYVKIYYLPGGDYHDMYQWGLIGLYKAVRHYDEERGKSFHLIAELNIKNTIKSAVTMYNRKKHYILNKAISLSVIADWSNTSDQLELIGIIKQISSDDPAEQIIENETIKTIYAIMDSVLSRLEKRVIELYIAGYKQREIAQILDFQEKIVDNAIQRAHKKMALHLKEWRGFCKKKKGRY